MMTVKAKALLHNGVKWSGRQRSLRNTWIKCSRPHSRLASWQPDLRLLSIWVKCFMEPGREHRLSPPARKQPLLCLCFS
jgi:hypothetical protein